METAEQTLKSLVEREQTIKHVLPDHYHRHGMECIREMALVFGTEAVKMFCALNAWKYRYRQKADGYDDQKADEYIAIIETIADGSFWEKRK